MPRIRTVKHGLFRSRTLAACSPRARLTFVGLWTLCDDEGRYEYEPELLKADLWPFEPDVSPKDTHELVLELAERGRVCLYESGGKTCLHIVNWHEHQKISHPGESKIPACHRETHGPPEPSGGFQSIPERSGTSRPRARALEQGTGIREQGEGRGNTVVEQARPIDDVTAVFHAWQTATGKDRARLDDKRRRKIQAALKAYPLADVLDAVQGWQHSPHHYGQNDQGTVYNELTLLLRDAEHIERFRDLARDGPPRVLSKEQQQMYQTHAEMSRWADAMKENGHDGGRVADPGRPHQRELSPPAAQG